MLQNEVYVITDFDRMLERSEEFAIKHGNLKKADLVLEFLIRLLF